MRLAELSAAERDYLANPLPIAEALSALLVRHFSRVLGARMKQVVQVLVETPSDKDGAVVFLVDEDAPEISGDTALEAMWLHGRLGGQSYAPSVPCSAMTKSLQRTLQLGLAETWISLPSTTPPKTLPLALSLRVEIISAKISVRHGRFIVRFPRSSTRMDQWAQHIIRHAS